MCCSGPLHVARGAAAPVCLSRTGRHPLSTRTSPAQSKATSIRARMAPFPRPLATATVNLVPVSTPYHFAVQVTLATPNLSHAQSGRRQQGCPAKKTMGEHAILSHHQPRGAPSFWYVATHGCCRGALVVGRVPGGAARSAVTAPSTLRWPLAARGALKRLWGCPPHLPALSARAQFRARSSPRTGATLPHLPGTAPAQQTP
jgi:hypothetical protein